MLKPLPWMRSTVLVKPWFGVTSCTTGVAQLAYCIVQGPVQTPFISASVYVWLVSSVGARSLGCRQQIFSAKESEGGSHTSSSTGSDATAFSYSARLVKRGGTLQVRLPSLPVYSPPTVQSRVVCRVYTAVWS